MVSQKVIAEDLKLSIGTVSRALANNPLISLPTRELVWAAAERLRYKPGRRQVLGTSKKSTTTTVGVLIGAPSIDNALSTFPYVLKGLQERASARRITLDVRFQDPRELDLIIYQSSLLRHMREASWKGTILIYPFSEATVRAMTERLSVVSALETYVSQKIDSIDVDDVSTVTEIVSHLYSLGHRRIGFVSWQYPVGGHLALRRFGGYVHALYYHGLEFEPKWTFNVHPEAPKLTPQEIGDSVVQLLKGDLVTAWVCAADHQAYPLVRDLHQRGVNVPRDCSITGFDGIVAPEGAATVTSIRVPHEHIGISSINRLVNRIENPTAPQRKILVEGEFVRGTSTAPPRQISR